MLNEGKKVGDKVAINGSGGFGFDVAEYLSHNGSSSSSLDYKAFMREWGIDMDIEVPGGVKGIEQDFELSSREIYLLQRKTTKIGAGLGKTTGWIHRTNLKKKNVKMIPGVSYDKIDDEGLHIQINGKYKLLDVDNIVICAGQTPLRELIDPLEKAGLKPHLIGGAFEAGELDAKRAIDQGIRLACII